MKFEDLIWVIIFLLYVVSVIWKKTRAASKDGKKGPEKRRPAWKEKLDKFISRVQQELEAAKKEGSKKETGWEKVLPRKDDELELAMKEVALKELEPIRKEISPERVEPVIEKRPSPKIKPALVDAVQERMDPTAAEKEGMPEDSGYGIQELRKAVIWSEILAPPLALRD
jgi:hypothetical protein